MLYKNQRITLTIDGYQQNGFGVGRHESGQVVFVPNAAYGETWEVLIVKPGKSLAYGKAEKLLSAPSADRMENDCTAFPACGGCAFRHINYTAELAWKKSAVSEALARIGQIDAGDFPLYPAPETAAYRNKAVFPVGAAPEGVVFGFYRAGSHRLIPITTCKIQTETANAAARAVCDFMEETHIAPYDGETRRGIVRYVFVRNAEASGESLVCLITAQKTLPGADRLISRLQEAVPGLVSVYQSVNNDPGNRILGRQTKLLWGKPRITEKLDGLALSFGPEAFFQVNSRQCEALYHKVLAMAEQAGNLSEMRVLDLYCGVGSIGLFLARRAKQVIGVEIATQAVADAKENARQNGISNAQFFCADAAETPPLLEKIGFSPDLVVVDPPRKGLGQDLCGFLTDLAPPHLIYVSCDPATLARDLKLLASGGFTVDDFAAFDLFPRTGHVECVVLMSRVEK